MPRAASTTTAPAKATAPAKKRAPRKTPAAAATAGGPSAEQGAGQERHAVQLLDLPIEQLLPNLRNVRRDVGDVGELAASIEEVGLLEPLVVAPHGMACAEAGDARWVLIAGHRRLAALQKLAWSHAPCLVRAGLGDEHEQVLAMLVENLQRSDLTPIEEATAYEQLTIAGFRIQDIARRTGRSRTTVEQRLQLMYLPERTRAKVHGRQLTLTDAEALLEFAGEPDTVAQLEKAIDKGELRWELERARRTRDERRKRHATVAELETRGVRVITNSEAASLYSQTLARYQLAEDEHATCPGHVASVTTNGQFVTYYCVEPERHSPSTATGDAPPAGRGEDAAAPSGGQLQADAARDEEQESCDIAARLRRAFILGITIARSPLPAEDVRAVAACLVATCAEVVVEPSPERWCQWLTRDELADRDWEEWERLLAGMLSPDAGRDPHRSLLAMLAAETEAQLQQPHAWAPSWLGDRGPGSSRQWLTLLQALGYELTAWEQGKVDAAEQNAAEQAAADAEDQGSEDQGSEDGTSTEQL